MRPLPGLSGLVRRFVLFPALALAAAAPSVVAQSGTGTIAGRVQNATNGSYLNNARVWIRGTPQQVFTDEFGDFRIAGVAAGAVVVEAGFTGLGTQSRELVVNPGSTTTHLFRLGTPGAGTLDEGAVIELDDFTVAAGRETNAAAIAAQEQRHSASLKNVVSADAFGDVTEGNIGEFMKFIPGVSVDYVAADVRTMSVRGFADNFTSVSVNGARMASSASGAGSRAFEFEQVSINNIARVEVTKSPTPGMPADSLGGAVNMISKNAFERDRAELRYRLYLNANSEEANPFAKSPGPMGRSTFKVLPGFDFDYTLPISDKFGIVVTGLTSNQFNEQHRTQNVWNFAQAGATPTNPYLQQYVFQDGPKNTFRDSVSVKADWRVAEGQVLSASVQSNYYKSQFGNRNITFNVGTNAAATNTLGATPVVLTYDADSVSGATGRGAVTGASSFRDKMGQTNAATLNYRYNRGDLEIEAGLNASKSRTWYRDTGRGHYSDVRTSIPTASATNTNPLALSRIEFDDITGERPGIIRALNRFGGEIDTVNLANYVIDTVRSNPLDASDQFVGGDLAARYKFRTAFPLAVKAGVATRKQTRDIRRYDETWGFRGWNGTTNRDASLALDTDYSGEDTHWGLPPQQWPDPYLLFRHLRDNPGDLAQTPDQARNAERFRRQNSQLLEERVDAWFLQFETRLLENRLNVVGGVRLEDTSTSGRGLLTTGPATTLAEVLANSVERGFRASRGYDDAYPSIHFTYNLTKDLLLRLSYAKTLGRPDFTEILPLSRVNDTDLPFDDGLGTIQPETIIVNNTGLLPWTADGYDLSLEYYLPSGGVISGGAFRKDLQDFWGLRTGPATSAELAELGLDPSYVGFDLRTRINVGDARISGFEFNYQQTLGVFGDWGRILNVFANGTKLDLEGPNAADFAKFIEDSASWGVTWSPKPVVLSLKWNYRGRQNLTAQTGAQYGASAGFREYYAPRTFLDVNAEYRFNRRFTLFTNARNVLNKQQTLERYNADSPAYSRTYRVEEFGVQFSVGVKGTF